MLLSNSCCKPEPESARCCSTCTVTSRLGLRPNVPQSGKSANSSTRSHSVSTAPNECCDIHVTRCCCTFAIVARAMLCRRAATCCLQDFCSVSQCLEQPAAIPCRRPGPQHRPATSAPNRHALQSLKMAHVYSTAAQPACSAHRRLSCDDHTVQSGKGLPAACETRRAQPDSRSRRLQLMLRGRRLHCFSTLEVSDPNSPRYGLANALTHDSNGAT
jgi:hypothetical protein